MLELSRKWKNRKQFCSTEAERTQQLRADELSRHELRKSQSTVRHFTVQIQDLQDKVNSVNDSSDFHDRETASSSGSSHVPSHPLIVPSSFGLPCRDSGPQLDTRNLRGTLGNVFENPPAPNEPTASCSGSVVWKKSYRYAWRNCP